MHYVHLTYAGALGSHPREPLLHDSEERTNSMDLSDDERLGTITSYTISAATRRHMLARLQVKVEVDAAATSAGSTHSDKAAAATSLSACAAQGAEQLVPSSERGTMQGPEGSAGEAERLHPADAHAREASAMGAAVAACSGDPDPGTASADGTGAGSAGLGAAPARLPLVDAVYSLLGMPMFRDVLRCASACHGLPLKQCK